MEKSDTIFIAIAAGLTILGIALRIAWILLVPNTPVLDFATFLEMASNIYHGRGHSLGGVPIAWVGPGYAYTLAIFHWIMGSDNPFNAMILNVILSSATLVMSFFVYRRWFEDDPVKTLVAYGITAVMPNFIAYNNVAGTETLFLFMLVGMVLVQLYVPGRMLIKAPALGVICGLAALTKPFMLAYPAVMLAIWWMQTKNPRRTLISTALMTAAMLVVIAPWTIRNFQAFDRFILISHNAGAVLMQNNNYGNMTGTFMPLEQVPMPEELRTQVEYSLRDGRSIKEAYELDPLFRAQGMHWIVRNPLAYMQLGFLRVQNTFFGGAWDITSWAMNDWDMHGGRTGSPFVNERHLNFAVGLFSVIVTVLSVSGLLFGLLVVWPYIGAFFCTSHRRSLPTHMHMVFINIAFFVVIAAAFEGQARYNHPVMFFFIYTLIWLCGRNRASQ